LSRMKGANTEMIKIEFELPVYTFHIDFVGHVNNAVYIQWMEIGRTKVLEAGGMPVDRLAHTGITGEGIVPILVSTEIEYKQPIFLGDRVRVEVWISELRHASARLEFRFYKEGDVLAASGSQKGLFVSRKTMRPQRLSREIKARFEPYVWREPAVGGGGGGGRTADLQD